MNRIVVRYSCGTPSAVSAKMTIKKYGHDRVVLTYSDTGSEHHDNKRFLKDCEKWFDHEITVLKSEKYKDTWDVWETNRFIKQHFGAPCTGYLKREPTYAFDRPDDIIVLGYTVDEKERADTFRKINFEKVLETPLIEAGLHRQDCHAIVEQAGIQLPEMYRLGYNNNNCIGCPKGGMGYWNKIRVDFPPVFQRMAHLQRQLGPGSSFWLRRGKSVSLDALDPNAGNHRNEPAVECSVVCHSVADHNDLFGPFDD